MLQDINPLKVVEIGSVDTEDTTTIIPALGHVWGGGEKANIRVWASQRTGDYPTPWNPNLIHMFPLSDKLLSSTDITPQLAVKDLWTTCMLEFASRVWVAITKIIVVLDKKGQILGKLQGHARRINDMKGKNKKLFSCSDDGSIFVWDTTKFTQLHKYDTGQGKIYTMLCVDKYLLCAGFGGVIQMWDRNDYSEVKKNSLIEHPHKDAIYCLITSQCGQVVWAGGWDGTISIWR